MAVAETASLFGTSIDELDTPVLCIDRAALDRNIERVAAICRRHGVNWRPHCKGHKSVALARRQLASGAIGVTCAKLGEAEVMATGGVRDLLIANQVVGPHKMRRLRALAEIADPIVTVDHSDQVRMLEAAMAGADKKLRAIVEVDIGLARAGVQPEETLTLARQIGTARELQFAGLMGYEGHLVAWPDEDEKSAKIQNAIEQLVAVTKDVEKDGLRCAIVSAGGSGSFSHTVCLPGITELQAGGLVLMDAFYGRLCRVDGFEHALWLLTTVVSRPTADRAIVDAGKKSVHGDLHVPLVHGRNDLRFERLSAEHGWLWVAPQADELRIGDRLQVIPGYSDFTCVLHDEFVVFEDRKVVDVWPLDARGRVR